MKIYKLNYKSSHKCTICPIYRARVTGKRIEERWIVRCESFKSCFWQPFRHIMTDGCRSYPSRKQSGFKSIWAHHCSFKPAQFLYQFAPPGMLIHKCVVPCFERWYAFLQQDLKLLKGSDNVFYWICFQPHSVALPRHVRLWLHMCWQVKQNKISNFVVMHQQWNE